MAAKVLKVMFLRDDFLEFQLNEYDLFFDSNIVRLKKKGVVDEIVIPMSAVKFLAVQEVST
ncbi:MAG: hypothetical protein QXZ28_03315 [Candidatus Methanomethylicaceae archaeon]